MLFAPLCIYSTLAYIYTQLSILLMYYTFLEYYRPDILTLTITIPLLLPKPNQPNQSRHIHESSPTTLQKKQKQFAFAGPDLRNCMQIIQSKIKKTRSPHSGFELQTPIPKVSALTTHLAVLTVGCITVYHLVSSSLGC